MANSIHDSRIPVSFLVLENLEDYSELVIVVREWDRGDHKGG